MKIINECITFLDKPPISLQMVKKSCVKVDAEFSVIWFDCILLYPEGGNVLKRSPYQGKFSPQSVSRINQSENTIL